MLYISVVVIAIVSIAWIATGRTFQNGYRELAQDSQQVLSNSIQTGSGDAR